MEDEKLMELYQTDDQEAFTQLYEKYAPLVYGYIKKKVPTSDVDDVYQNVWKQFHEKRYLYSHQPFAPWFFTLIRNLIVDEYRSNSRKIKLIQKLSEVIGDGHHSHTEDVEGIISTLPPQSQELVRKYFLEGYSYAELENEMGLSQMGLRKRLSRVISHMKREIKGFDDEK